MSNFEDAVIQRIKQLEREVERLQKWERPIVITDHGALAGLGDDDHTQYTTHPESSTDNAVPRFDGTDGKKIQNSLVIINDSGDIDGKLINGMLINYQHVEISPTANVYIKLATLPKSASGTYASARMDGIIGSWGATQIAMYSFFAGNRESEQFYFTYTGSKTKFYNARILAYKRSTGELDICHFVLAGSYTTFSANLSSVQGTIERSPASFIPSGTKVFDSYDFTL